MAEIMILTSFIICLYIIVLLYRKNKSYQNRITGQVTDVILTPDELKIHAVEIALRHLVSQRDGSCLNLIPRMDENYRHIIKAYKILNSEAAQGKTVIAAAEWLFDNFYIIEEQVKEIRLSFKKGCSKKLPCLKEGLLKGFPRIYDIALELVSHTDSRIDEKLFVDFIKSYQSKSQLTDSEIWAIPLMLKMALIENIRHICDSILKSQEMRGMSDKLADIIIDEEDESERIIENIRSYMEGMEQINSAFAENLIMRIRRYGNHIEPALHYIGERLANQNTNADSIIMSEHQDQARKQVSIGNTITSIRLLSAIDWPAIFEDLSPVEQVLRGDPAKVYSKMDFTGRNHYRHIVENLAQKLKISEGLVAKKAIECAKAAKDCEDVLLKHVGYYLMGDGMERLELALEYKPGFATLASRFIKSHPSLFYLFPIIIMTFGISFLLSAYAARAGAGIATVILSFLVSFFPSSEIAVRILNWVVNHMLRPSFLPKLEFRDGIPKDDATFVVIPALISGSSRVKELVGELEVYYLANHERNIYFALLGDFADSSDKDMPGDDEIVNCALQRIKALNKKYSSGGEDIFFFFHRIREYNPSQGVWMGWERKRGKLIEFNRLLRGDENTGYNVMSCDISSIPQVKYIITLDADTQLPRDTAKRLIGTISHVLNRPVLNPDNTKVIRGYGILQPRVNIDIVNARKSLFSRIFAGAGGIDPYTTAVSDIYMDLFCEGIYTGKGIYDIDVFEQLLDGSIPENAILSHDLLEGSFARTGLVTDIELVDGFPSKYSSYSARMHRWARGDWQLLPYLSKTVKNSRGEYVKNTLSVIDKWKIVDNLRRSIMPASIFILIILSLSILPGSKRLWFALSALTISLPVFAGIADFILMPINSVNGVASGLRKMICQIGLLLAFLPHRAYLMVDAIIRTLVRLSTKQRLLEWETAADAEARLKNKLANYIKTMWICPALGIVLPTVWLFFGIPNLNGILALSALWFVSPYIAYTISRDIKTKKAVPSDEDIQDIRLIARKTWRYFEDFVSLKDNYLPPDNFQEGLPHGLAHRTSPTNIGLYLVSALSAYDLGYISTCDLIETLHKTFDSMDKLDRWRGHFYNWYDTVTMQPLRPLYVSTVDSGNLIAYLMVLNEGLKECMDKPLINVSIPSGLIDTIKLLNREMGSEKFDYKILEKFLNEKVIDTDEWLSAINEMMNMLERLKEHEKSCPYFAKVYDLFHSFKKEMENTMPWIEYTDTIPDEVQKQLKENPDVSDAVSGILSRFKASISLNGLSREYTEAFKSLNSIISSLSKEEKETALWLKNLKSKLIVSYLYVNRTMSTIREIIKRSDMIIKDTEFKPLFDDRRQLFSIGYNAEDEQLTRSYYDLLASESRQTSFIAIAKGDVDQKHWFRMDRSMTSFGSARGLVSWSGTMFEYLMPLLIMKNYENTLLDATYRFALKSQIEYGRMRNVPWGVSESGYNSFDINLNYQYRAFGVPRLGLKRGLVNDIVIAPYASIMASMVDVQSAVKNLRLLSSLGAEGEYGFYEAVDYTPERVKAGKKYAIVKSFMVHHHGMSMLSFDNVINGEIMQLRFHNNPMVKACELLLQEKVPYGIMFTKDIEEEISQHDWKRKSDEEYIKELKGYETAFPQVHVISNGNYHTMITSRGDGFSRVGGISVTRWNEKLLYNGYGMFFYIRNINSNEAWSASYEPMRKKPEEYKVVFSSDKAEYCRTDGNIDTRMEIVISPEDNVEIRTISLTNHSSHSRIIEVTSYFEVVLSPIGADIAHPAFNNLFVRTEYVPDKNILLANKRPKESKQKPLWLFHTALIEGETVGALQYETDRSKFIGRGRNLQKPAAMDIDSRLSGTSGAVLDPIMSIRKRVRIKSGETAKISYLTGLAYTRRDALNLAEKYNGKAAVSRAFELAWTQSQVEARYLNLISRDIELYQMMLSHIFYISPLRREREDIIRKNAKGQSGLWQYGISGDFPIVLVTVGSKDDLSIVEDAVKAHEFWRSKGLKIDMIILNEDAGNYLQEFNDRIRKVILSNRGGNVQDKPGGIFLRQASIMDEESLNLIYSVSRIAFSASNGSLRQQLKIKDFSQNRAKKDFPAFHNIYQRMPETLEELAFFNGLGGFKKDGSEYVIWLEDKADTPAPWSNIICNEEFGCLVTSSGSGYTWAENSREFKISPWSNDPVMDPPGEILYLVDEAEGGPWSIAPLPVRENEPYTIRHGFGYSIFEHVSHGIKQEMTVFVPNSERIKIVKLRLKNISYSKRKLKACYYMRPVLGVNTQMTAPFIVSGIDDNQSLVIRNTYSDDFPGRVVVVDCSAKKRSITGDNVEFMGLSGEISAPEALLGDELSGKVGGGFEPCAAIMANVELAQNEEKVIAFTISEGEDEKSASALALKYRDIYQVDRALREAKGFWRNLLSIIHVNTPDISLNMLTNGWLMYQAICCRLWGRSAFYQSGGAYGFRDQLQDAMAASYVYPELTKKQIILHSSHQFLEGDVQHWWHPGSDKGVRTRFSDDRLWLAYVVADYIEVTDDMSILDIETPFLEGEPLKEGEDERYEKSKISDVSGTIYEHCIRAIEKSLNFGEHGIPLMGSGDWNDGMNNVGNKGRGESIWLGWFLYKILKDFAPICTALDDEERSERYLKTADDIASCIEKSGWDGSWYRRAYFDDGTPLGSASNSECQIDSIAQSWSVISGGGDPERSHEAMVALENYLINKDAGIIMLLTPPFDTSDLNPGYIKGYVPGVRENGGQYTHAAVWVILAQAMMGFGDKAWELFRMINPINHTSTQMNCAKYKVEPYVLASDVYGVEPQAGRGGWTWYTGAAGWMYRVLVEHMLGLKLKGSSLSIEPCIPCKWKEYAIEYRYMDTHYVISVKNLSGYNRGVMSIRLDGRFLNDKKIKLVNDRLKHTIEVVL